MMSNIMEENDHECSAQAFLFEYICFQKLKVSILDDILFRKVFCINIKRTPCFVCSIMEDFRYKSTKLSWKILESTYI